MRRLSPFPIDRRILRILFDLATVLVEIFFFDDLVRQWDEMTAGLFFFVYLAYCAGLWTKRRDRAYMQGLVWFSDKKLFWISSFFLLQTVLGAMAFASFQETSKTFIPKGMGTFLNPAVLILVFPMAFALMIRLVRQARRDFSKSMSMDKAGDLKPADSSPANFTSMGFGLISDLGIWLMGLSLLSFFYNLAQKIVINLDFTFWGMVGALFLSFALGLLFYYPARFHIILENPKDRSNWIGFFGAMVLFAWFLINR